MISRFNHRSPIARLAVLLLMLLPGAADAQLQTLDFEDLVPGSVFRSEVSGDFRILAAPVPPDSLLPVDIEVNPGAPSCPPGVCDWNGSSSLFVLDGFPIILERVGGTPFTPVSALLVTSVTSGSGFCAYDGTTEAGTQLGTQFIPCPDTPSAPTQLPDHGPLLSFWIWGVNASLQLDDLIVDVGGTPPPPAHVTLLTDARRVSASGTDELWDEYGEFLGCSPIENDSASPSPDFTDFNDSAAAGSGGYGSQYTVASTSGFSGTGFASGYSDYCWGFGYSIFRVTFRVDSPVTLHFSGDLSASGYTLAQARLQKGATNVFLAETWDVPLPFDHESVLGPGEYTLTVQADGGNAWVDASYDFSASFTEAPIQVPIAGFAGRAALAALLVIFGLATRASAAASRPARDRPRRHLLR